jgi:hypothetical protein
MIKKYSECNSQCRVGQLPADVRTEIDEAFLKGVNPFKIAHSPKFQSLQLSESGVYRHVKNHIFHKQLIPDELAEIEPTTPVNFVPPSATERMGVSDLIVLATKRVRELEQVPNRNATQERQLLDWSDKLNKSLDLALKSTASNETEEQQKMRLIGWEIGHWANSKAGQLALKNYPVRKHKILYVLTPNGTNEIHVPEGDIEYDSPDVFPVRPENPTRSIDDASVQALLARLAEAGRNF